MKILLINPASKIWILAKTLPLGLAYIAAYLEKNNFAVEVIDLAVNPNQTIPRADIVGITAATPLIAQAWKIAKKIKYKNKKTLIVLGGPHPTCLSEESLEKEYIDVVVRGEGEITMLELARAVLRKKDFNTILGISYKKKNKIIHNQNRPFITNLDSLPFPAYHKFGQLNQYTNPQPLLGSRRPAINIITSRGCPYGCIFCYKGTFGRIWRARSPENVLAEWGLLVKKFGVKEIGIQDDNFNVDTSRAIKICRLIQKKKLIIPWSTPNGIRADFATEELLREMKKAGCYRIAFGVESGDQKVLDYIIGKNLKLSKVKKAFKLARKYKIKTIAFFMMGNPGETQKQMKKTIKFALQLQPDFAQFTTATPFPGTRLFALIQEKGKFKIKNWAGFSQFDQKAYFEFPGQDPELPAKMVKRAYQKFYFRPAFMAKFLADFQTWKNLPNIISATFHFLFKGR
ncbi:MAG: hypothetical protein COS97_00080 [Candidatus Nealsonbacteria bacterium CG07_land_8_20_14_0_80_40_10]|nr:MAG: hypothetical protein COS97_00080 [Candidatus Nealsonbacteria bacterium CG07_land_8_20_14_0_80_40_10]